MLELSIGECDDIALARELLGEYFDATIEEVSWPPVIGAETVSDAMRAEVEDLPGLYCAPEGALLVARLGTAPVGSVGLARFDDSTVEMKRLWVRPATRRVGVGRALTVASLERAAQLGYRRVALDLVPERTGAIELYRSVGFVEIDPYRAYPFPMVFMGRGLD